MKHLTGFFLLLCLALSGWAQKVPYGNNPETGAHFDVKGTQLYYEVYGQGSALLPHAVQYVSHPEYGWRKLREEHSGTYENALSPAPDPEAWLKVKVAIQYPQVKVFINGSSVPCLEVEQLQAYQEGPIGFWVGNNSEGYFRNLKVTPE